MERHMGTTIATKGDLQLLRQEMATKADVAEFGQDNALIRKDTVTMSTAMTVRLGSVLMLGLLFAALELT
jgi:hypothetical protein